MKRLILVGLIVLLSYSFGFAQTSPDMTFEVTSSKGNVKYRLLPKDAWQDAKTGTLLKVMAQVATGKDGYVEITHPKGVIRLVSPNDTLYVYDIVSETNSVDSNRWNKTTWQAVCKKLDSSKGILKEVEKVTSLKGTYRVDWDNYNLEALYWKMSDTKEQIPTYLHLRSAITAMEKIKGKIENADEMAELSFLIAECEWMAGNEAQAKKKFGEIIKAYPNTSWSQKAKQRL